jgi:hypothetical protein
MNGPSRETDNNGHTSQMAQTSKQKHNLLANILLPFSNKAGDYKTKNILHSIFQS